MQLFKDNYSKWTTLFFVAMTVFAVVFANERFQADGAHYLLHVVQSESFRVEHQRFILIFSQVLPWAGVQVDMPLNAIIVLNSLNPILWWLLLFLYASRFLKDRHAAIGILLTHVLGVIHIQFTPMYEIWYGVPLIVLLYAHLRNDRVSKPLDLILFFGILITCLFAHPLLPIPVAFVFLYDAIEKRKLRFPILISSAIVVAGWYIAKKLMLTSYEQGKMALLGAESSHPGQLLEFSYHWKLLVYLFTWYTIPMLLVVWLTWFFGLRKMKLQLLVTLVFVIGHIFLINFTHENSPNQTPYFERMYLPLIPIVLIPFLFTLCRELQFSHGFILLSLLAVMGWRIGRFFDVGREYKLKTEMTTHLIHKAQSLTGSKFVLNPNDFTTCFGWADWSFPMETLIRSAAYPPYRRVTIVSQEDLAENNNTEKLDEDEFLFRRWEIMKDKDLNQKYFHLMPGKYEVLPAGCVKK